MNYECVGESGKKVNLHEVGKNRFKLNDFDRFLVEHYFRLGFFRLVRFTCKILVRFAWKG